MTMLPCSLLPAPLLVLLFAFPAIAAPSSPNDLFRDIALQSPKKPEPEICCLRPLEPPNPTPQEDVLLPFEAWKAKRLSESRDHVSTMHPSTASNHKPGGTNGSGDDIPQSGGADITVTANESQTCKQDAAESTPPDSWLSPHFRIPLTDRFNYASTDCSARVHSAHRSAKSPSSILSSKKDKYMLSPCAEERQFVVVELCDDIMIDTVQMANFEFFSGVFKDFTVSVAKTYPPDESLWEHAGTYKAQNIRGVQSFHPPSTLRDFYRFIRIEFHSHYGSEYYCPLSLLRVYGLTHLEQWKWDEWEQESRRLRRVAEESGASIEMRPEPPQFANIPAADPLEANDKAESSSLLEVAESPAPTVSIPSYTSSEGGTAPALDWGDPIEITQDVAHALTQSMPEETLLLASHESGIYSLDPNLLTASDDHAVRLTYPPQTSPPATSSVLLQELPAFPDPQSSDISGTSLFTKSSQSVQSTRVTISTASYSPTHSVSSVSISVPIPPQSPHATTGGESIYRTIMNRLTALEANTTLYARYVEEQTAGVREMLRRLSEDIGRLEGLGRAQAQAYQRSIMEFDRQRRRLELEHSELLSKVNHLTDEVILEKRLGIAQLCLLLAVLVFMTLTRGSRGELIHRTSGLSRPSGMRDWGRRTLSLTLGKDWVNRLRSRSPTPKPTAHLPSKSSENSTAANKVEFPTKQTQTSERASQSRTFQPGSSSRKLSSRPRTPSSLRLSSPRLYIRPLQHTATAPSSAMSRPPIQRSASGGMAVGFGSGPSVKSAKRWARSSHLHEVKSAVPELDAEFPSNDDDGPQDRAMPRNETRDRVHDVFSPEPKSTSGNDVPKNKSSYLRPGLSPLCLTSARELAISCVRTGPSSEADGSEGDGWVDTDGGGSESEAGGAGEGPGGG